jgi:carboxyl-terminal processing protease
VETRGRGKVLLQRYETTSDGKYLDSPMAVLVNQFSASAAEIVAACLQDDGRAIVVGQRSYGKGTVQQLLPLESGKSLLKLTWASFWRPNGVNIHHMPTDAKDAKWGVTPDAGYDIPLSTEDYKIYVMYREKRDDFGPIGDAEDTDRETAAKIAAFSDKPLGAAVKYLEATLAAK